MGQWNRESREGSLFLLLFEVEGLSLIMFIPAGDEPNGCLQAFDLQAGIGVSGRLFGGLDSAWQRLG